MKKKKTMDTDSNQIVLTGLTGKYCYYQVRSWGYAEGSLSYSAWSKKGKVRLK